MDSGIKSQCSSTALHKNSLKICVSYMDQFVNKDLRGTAPLRVGVKGFPRKKGRNLRRGLVGDKVF